MRVNNTWVEFDARDSVVVRDGEMDLPVPPGSALVRAEFSSISPGTELAQWHGTVVPRPHLQDQPLRYPVTPGYSMIAVVVESADPRVKPGQRLLVRRSHRLYNVVDLNRRNMWAPVPDDMASSDASLGTLAQIAMTAPMSIDIRLGHRVLVVGLGVIGYLAAQWFTASAALEVQGCDMQPDRVAFASQRGIQAAGVEQIESRVKQQPYDIVVEATGSGRAVQNAFRYVREGGAVLLLGTSRDKLSEFDVTNAIHRNLVTVIGAHTNRHDRPAVVGPAALTENTLDLSLRYIHASRINVQGLIGRTFASRDAARAYAAIETDRLYTAGIDWRGAEK
jgi:2-desacetyl-2-hydroxyethyl bacteriochlorophyllide A dehydrogenase